MKPRPDPSTTLFAMTVVLATVIHFPALRGQATTRPNDTCGQLINCGDMDFDYPFWGLVRPQHCGHPGFQLTCPSDVPILRIDTVNYRVLDKDSSTQTITIARNDLWNTNCPQNLYNTTYNSTLFNGNNFGQETVSLFYGCQDNIVTPPPTLLADNFRFGCGANGTWRNDSYFYRTSAIVPEIGDFLEQCNSSMTVPVDGSRANIVSANDLRSALQAGFKLRWMADNDNCDRCIRSNGQCGSNATSPDVFTCYCRTGNFSVTCDNISVENGFGGNSRSSSLGIALGIVGAVIVVVGVGCGIFVFRQRRKRRTTKEWVNVLHQNPGLPASPKGTEATNDKIEIFIRNYGTLAPKRYKYSEIKKMTNSFIEKLGHGGYGSVYKGQLPDGRRVAVKLLSEATGNGEDFINEVASIGRTSHVNIVTLLGFCFEGKKRALLYEYMPNRSLDKFIRGDGPHLDWNTLFQIAKGIARGLEYLHRGCNTRIVHFDIKPHNILLDEDFVPKISDFGLAKLCKTKESIVSVMGARGTAGYMAPEVFIRSLGGASHKSDVYSYGMMVLEMTGARKRKNTGMTSTSEAYFPDWVYKQVEVGSTLGDNGVTTEEEDELARKMMMVSLWCIQTDPSDRPSISKVVEMLEGSIESLQVPPRRFDSSPAMPLQGTFPSSTQSSSSERVSAVQEKISLSNSYATS